MGNNKEGLLIAGAIIVAVLLLGQQNGTPADTNNGGTITSGGIDICKLVDGQVSFTGQNRFLTGTALTADYVRVIRMGSILDLGQISMDSGTIGTTPKANYKLYYGENTSSGTRYTSVEDYSAPCQDSTDNKVGVLCTVDSSPTITIFDENGQVNTAGTNTQEIGASDIIDMEIKIKASADSCYGNPEAEGKNAICFNYNTTVYDSIKSNTNVAVTPYSISNAKLAGLGQSCYQFDKISDTGSTIVTITIDAASTEPTSDHNISISLEDVAFDLDQDTLGEIWAFNDETNNNLGVTSPITASIDVS